MTLCRLPNQQNQIESPEGSAALSQDVAMAR